TEMLKGGISVEFLLKKATRNMHHGLMKREIWDESLPNDFYDDYFICLEDYVVRYWSASSLIVEGVKADENPEATTLWTLLGFPLTCLVTPVWIGAGESLPTVILSEDGENPLLVIWSLTLKEKCFPYVKGNGKAYMNIAPLKNKEQTGFLQKLIPQEDIIITKARTLQNEFYQKGVKKKEVDTFNKWLNSYIQSCYQSIIKEYDRGNQ
ncbi:MAG: hypothetical protein PHE86_00265, partial [Candidatus Marinimicrobia bacterium]|nr:hypothetical protein [Candidatus Neomarinimicrobiota bacterium]